MDEEPIWVVSRDRGAQLLHGPWRRGVSGHIDMYNASGRVFYDHEHVEEAKGCDHHHTKVAGNDRLGMMTDKC
jgi:hypothetical protein